MAVILQEILQRCRLAQDLLTQRAFENNADLLIISEQYSILSKPGWYADATGTAAIWIGNKARISAVNCGKGSGYVWITSPSVTYITCYFSPNEEIGVFRQKLENLEDTIRNLGGEVIVAGDFNAKS